MPTYEYICPTCKKPFDVFKKMSESDRAEQCPDCATPAQRVVNTGRPAIYFHGRGWSCVDKNYKDGQ